MFRNGVWAAVLGLLAVGWLACSGDVAVFPGPNPSSGGGGQAGAQVGGGGSGTGGTVTGGTAGTGGIGAGGTGGTNPGGSGGTGGCPDSTGQYLWSGVFGDPADYQYAKAVATDSSGNIVVAGEFGGSIDFGGPALTGTGLYLAKLDAAGNHLWSKAFQTSSPLLHGVAVGPAGEIVIVGTFQSGVDFGGGTLYGAGNTYDAFVAKFDAGGNHLWSRRFGDSVDAQTAEGVVIDGSGSIIVYGSVQGGIDFGGGPLVNVGQPDPFLVKLDANAGYVWSRQLGGLDYAQVLDLAVSDAGDIAVVGTFTGMVNLGAGTVTSTGAEDAFLTQFNSAGDTVFGRTFGASVAIEPEPQHAEGVAFDSTGNLYLSGSFYTEIDFGGAVLEGPPNFPSVFVVELSSSGQHVRSKRFGDGNTDIVRIRTDRCGNVLLAGGYMDYPMSFGGPELPVAGGEDMFFVKLDPQFDHLWSRHVGDGAAQTVMTLHADAFGDMLAGGYVEGTVNFGGGDVTLNGNPHAFVTKYAP